MRKLIDGKVNIWLNLGFEHTHMHIHMYGQPTLANQYLVCLIMLDNDA